MSPSSKRLLSATLATGVALLCACSNTAPPRAQAVVIVDTDAPLAGQLAGHPQWSVDAAVDTVRIDVLAEAGTLIDTRLFVAPEALDWPLSFGVQSASDSSQLHLRIRAFRSIRARSELVEGFETLSPLPESTIDRLVLLTLPQDGVERFRVVLHGDCYGAQSSFKSLTTCLSSAEPSAPADSGVEHLADGASVATVAGSWSTAFEVPCTGSAPPGAVCVPGGFTLMGEPDLGGLGDLAVDPLPIIPSRLSPFWMDVMEVTVGDLRKLFDNGLKAPLPFLPGDTTIPFNQFCTWSTAPGALEDRPANCITAETAAAACAARGGALPSEAQWEHAARGRQRRQFPWGDEHATCCAAALSRYAEFGSMACGEYPPGTAAVGSNPISEACAGLGDESRDHVLDLAGNVSELTRDRLIRYDGECWQHTGVATDPECLTPATAPRTVRGGNFAAGLGRAHVALRTAFGTSPSDGFRCVYQAGP